MAGGSAGVVPEAATPPPASSRSLPRTCKAAGRSGVSAGEFLAGRGPGGMGMAARCPRRCWGHVGPVATPLWVLARASSEGKPRGKGPAGLSEGARVQPQPSWEIKPSQMYPVSCNMLRF